MDKKIIVAVAAIVAVVIIAAVALVVVNSGKVTVTYDANGGVESESGETIVVVNNGQIQEPYGFINGEKVCFWWNTEATAPAPPTVTVTPSALR